MRPKVKSWVVVTFVDGPPEVGFVCMARTQIGSASAEVFFPNFKTPTTEWVKHKRIIAYAVGKTPTTGMSDDIRCVVPLKKGTRVYVRDGYGRGNYAEGVVVDAGEKEVVVENKKNGETWETDRDHVYPY